MSKTKALTLDRKELRVAVCYGPPAVGTSTILSCLKASSNTPMRVVRYFDATTLEQDMRDAEAHGEKVVLADVEGGVFEPADVRALNDARVVYADVGALIRFWAFPADIMARAGKHQTYAGSVTEEELAQWAEDMSAVDAEARLFAVRQFTIPAFDLEEAVKTLALRLGVRD